MIKDHHKLYKDGYQLIPNFISKIEVTEILKRLNEFELSPPKYNYDVLDRPIITLFVAGFKNEQILIDLKEFKEIQNVINKISLDVKNRIKPKHLYAYEITIFKKKKGSPSLYLHQDSWYHPFKLTNKLFEYFSYYIPLTKFNEESSLLGLVSLNNFDVDKTYNSRHIITGDFIGETATQTATQNILPDLINKINYPKMNQGDCMIFEIRTPHNSKQHLIEDSRYALSVRFCAVEPEIDKLDYSYGNFVKQLKLYGNKILLKLV